MNKTCELLKKSFYEDEWVLTSGGADIWVRQKDGIELWGSNGFMFFTGYRNNLRIPVYLRPYMFFHLKRGQNLLATKKLLAEPLEALKAEEEGPKTIIRFHSGKEIILTMEEVASLRFPLRPEIVPKEMILNLSSSASLLYWHRKDNGSYILSANEWELSTDYNKRIDKD